jgi:hypothetical protein
LVEKIDWSVVTTVVDDTVVVMVVETVFVLVDPLAVFVDTKTLVDVLLSLARWGVTGRYLTQDKEQRSGSRMKNNPISLHQCDERPAVG